MRTKLLATLVLLPALAVADEGTDDSPVPKDLARLINDTGRQPVPTPEAKTVKLTIRGEYQLRGQLQSSFPMDPTLSFLVANPGAREASLGQNGFFTNWLRVTPRLQIRESVEIAGQLDIAQGFVFGQTSRDVSSDQQPRDNMGDAGTYLLPRWLFLSWRTKYGLWRIGMQGKHWGMGILANDGDHPSIWGDARLGSISERVLFGTKPLGEKSPWTVALAGDVVYRDAQARLYRGDVALQGVLATYVEKGPNQLGLFAVVRSQSTEKQSGTAGDLFKYSDDLTAGVVDVAGKFAAPVPGNPSTFVYGAAEGALVFGDTNMLRTPDQARTGQKTKLLSYGTAALVGLVHTAARDAAPKAGAPDHWGDLVGQVEVGYASGDADPYDGTEKRFTFDPNHRVGLLLFDEIMRWQTARASVAAQDPLLGNAQRPTPGVQLLPSNGGVFGAQYVNPTFIWRPRHFWDLKAGAVVAQTTADLVSPYRLALDGAYVNYRGGSSKARDLGVEVDLGTEVRIPVQSGVLNLGAQGGVLFPGGAFADARGKAPSAPWIATVRAGLQF